MSYDRSIDQVCPHMVVEEALFVSADRVTVRPLRPIAAFNSVRVRYNSEIEVPSAGFYTSAQATSLKSAPYNIQGGTNDRLVIKVGGGPFQTLTLPSGKQLSAPRVVEVLNQSVRDAVFSVTSKRQIRLNSSSTGPSATIFIRQNGSTGASTLGFTTDRGWRGQTVTPGWSLINDPNTLRDRPTRLIVFDDILKGSRDYVELNYVTIREECRRCGGLGIENDWRYNSQGTLIKVQDEQLLHQELLKSTYTVKGSNPFHTWYGTNIVNTIGRKLSSTGIIQNMIVSEVYEAFRRWQGIKKQQEEVVGQLVTDKEFPFRMLSVNLRQSDHDPTVIFVSAVIQSRSTEPILIERGVRTPIPLDLLGSTQQESLVRAPLPNYNIVE